MSATETAKDSPSQPGIDVSRTLTFFFEDPNWVTKLLIGSLFAALIPFLIGAIFLTGYAVALARRTMKGEISGLPEWDDFPSLFVDGLRGLGLSLAHKLPLILLTIILVFALAGGILLEREGGSAPDGLLFYGLPALFAGWVLFFVLSLAVLLYGPAAFVRFVRTNSLAAGFDFTENLGFIRRHTSDYVLALLAIVLAGFISQFGLLVFCIGIFPTVFWCSCVMGFVIGQLARLDREPGATP
jgi:hypothetical protein